MSKFVKPIHDYHELRLRSDNNEGELLLVGKGRTAYLWAGVDGNFTPVTFSGQQTLRKLAKHILKVVPERGRK